jgi:hypothetical protein
VIVLWAIWINEAGCYYPEGGEPELYDEEGAFCRACVWTCGVDDARTYRAVPEPPRIRWETMDVVGGLFA